MHFEGKETELLDSKGLYRDLIENLPLSVLVQSTMSSRSPHTLFSCNHIKKLSTTSTSQSLKGLVKHEFHPSLPTSTEESQISSSHDSSEFAKANKGGKDTHSLSTKKEILLLTRSQSFFIAFYNSTPYTSLTSRENHPLFLPHTFLY